MSVLLRHKIDVPDLSQRALGRAAKGAYLALGDAWDRLYKPRHFSPQAKGRYGYQTRKAKYTAGKFKKYRHRRPLVYSGRTEQAVRGRAFPRVFPRRVVVNLPTPQYIRIRPYKSGHPPLADEITRLSPDEREALEALWAEEMESGIQDELEKSGNYQALALRM